MIIDVQRLFEPKQVVLSEDGISVPETVSQRGWEPWTPVPPLLLRQALVGFGHPRRKARAEDLPVLLQLQPDLCKPRLNVRQQLFQLPLVGAEDGEIVHLPQVVA